MTSMTSGVFCLPCGEEMTMLDREATILGGFGSVCECPKCGAVVMISDRIGSNRYVTIKQAHSLWAWENSESKSPILENQENDICLWTYQSSRGRYVTSCGRLIDISRLAPVISFDSATCKCGKDIKWEGAA
jgi:hypothetical protein